MQITKIKHEQPTK